MIVSQTNRHIEPIIQYPSHSVRIKGDAKTKWSVCMGPQQINQTDTFGSQISGYRSLTSV